MEPAHNYFLQKASQYFHKTSEPSQYSFSSRYNISNTISSNRTPILPADPLLKRKILPLNSPRFGKLKKYLVLPSFNPNGSITKFEYKTQYFDKRNIQLEKQLELESYANSAIMIKKLIYAKFKLDKDNKVDLSNIIDLKKPLLFDKKSDHNLPPYYTIENSEDNTLVFESRFESGNLLYAFKYEEMPPVFKYELILQNDSNTTGYVQWFFFRVSNTKRKSKATINIINLLRKTSLYSNGLKVWCYSEKKAVRENVGWFRGGENITYFPNNYYMLTKDKRRQLYTLSFDYEFTDEGDTVYFANSLPYLYTDLMKELNNYQIDEETKYPYFHRKTLCTTLGGNDMDIFTINSMWNLHQSNKNYHQLDRRKGIVFLARQHPGETCSSYVMKGAIDFLLGNSNEAAKLRELYLIKVVPMMNPDGVIVGNSRTSFAGCDLNRRWANPHEIIHPEIYFTKEMIMKMAAQRDIGFICDFHSHIGAYNSFFYCNYKENRRLCSLFPFICSKTNKIISFVQSIFQMPRFKSGTGRISLFRDLELNNIVTLETSFFGSNRPGQYHHVYFTPQIFQEIGRDICLGMLSYYYKYENRAIEKNINTTDIDMHEFEAEISKPPETEIVIDENSESEPSIDNFEREKIIGLLPAKAKLKKKRKKKAKQSLIKILFQHNTKKTSKDNKELNNTNFDIKLSQLKPSASAVFIGNKMPLIKEPKSVSIPKTIPPLNVKSKLGLNNNEVNKPVEIDKEGKAKEFVVTKCDQATQTERIFFKMHWSYFAGEYPIKQASKTSQDSYENRYYEKLINRNRGLNGNHSFSNSKMKYPLIVQGGSGHHQPNPLQNQFLYGKAYKK